MVNINDLTVTNENEDNKNIDKNFEKELEHTDSHERKQVMYDAPEQITNHNHRRKSCQSWLKNLWLFTVLILLFLSLLDMSEVFSLHWNNSPLGIWYVFASLILVFFLFFARWFVGKAVISLLFLVVVGWLTGIGVYQGFVHTPNADTTQFSYDFASGTDSATILVDSFISHSYIQANTTTGVAISYDWDRIIHDTSESNNTIVLEEEKSWSILDSIDSSTNIFLWSDISYSVSILWVIQRSLVDLRTIDRNDLSLQGLWNDVRIHVGQDTGKSITIHWRYAGAHIIIPKNVWIKLHYNKVVWSLAIQDFIMINKKEYQSSNYAEADTKIDVFVDSIIGKVRIEYN